MMRVRAVGLEATIDLHDHHLIIHRQGGMFSGGPTELMVPLNSIKSVQFRRPSGWRSGRIIISLEGAAAPKLSDYQRKMDPMSVTFSDYHLPAFEQVLEVIREAIAMPSIEQMAMGAQRNRQEQVSQARPQPKPTRAVLERIDSPRQSYNPNTGANYDDTGTSGHQAYHHPGGGRADEPPLNPSVGEWWREVHPLAKIILIAIPIIVLLAMCSGPGEDAAPSVVEPAIEATEVAEADAPAPDTEFRERPNPAMSAAPPSQPHLRKGQRYAKVRQILLAHGYIPANYTGRDCAPYGTAPGEECYDRPEIASCSGTGQGFCSGYWLRGEDGLSVLVAEGPNGVFEDASAITRSDIEAVLAQNGQGLAN